MFLRPISRFARWHKASLLMFLCMTALLSPANTLGQLSVNPIGGGMSTAVEDSVAVRKPVAPEELLDRTIVPEEIQGGSGGFRNPMLGPQDTTPIQPKRSKAVFNPSLKQQHLSQSDRNTQEALPEKVDSALDFDSNLTPPAPSIQNSIVNTPNVGVETQVNYNTDTYPPDPVCAVSGPGYIVTFTNTHVHYFNEDGDMLYESTENNFWSSVRNTDKIYDPRVEYDTYHNRFIAVILDGGSSHSDNCQILIAISVSSNPLDGWHFYHFSGVEGLTNRWVDYTTIGHSTNDIIIAGNILNTATPVQYMQTRVWQMSKAPLYSGASAFSLWQYNHVEDQEGLASFTTHPVSRPLGGYGPGAYLVSKNYTNGVCWFDITEDATDDPVMYAYCTIGSNRNWPEQSVDQGGTWQHLDVSDKLMNAYYGDGTIHYTGSYLGSDGWDKIYVGQLDVSSGDVQDMGYGSEGFHYAYPYIMPWASSPTVWGGGSCVTFLRVSDDSYPEFRVTHMNGDFDFSSSVSIKYGSGPIVDRLMDDGLTNRWGDYLGGSWRENQGQPEFWVIGQYGLSTGGHGVWLAEVALDIFGCTNSAACNYNPNATESDGSCDFSTCAGCMDAEACNFNPNAEIPNESCTYPGCTHLGACNYEPLAGCLEEGSCCMDHCIEIHMPFGNPEIPMTNMTYSIVANSNDTISMNVATGSNLYTNVVKHCLEPGCYTIFMNGGIGFEWSVQEDPGPLQPVWMDNLLLAEGTGTSAVTFIVGDGAGMTGCTDDMACNFDPMAICDDESCCYENCFQVAMESSSPLGWQGAHWIIENVASGSIIATGTMGPSLGGGSALTVDVGCLDPGCYVIYVDDGPAVYTPSLSYTLYGADGDPIEGNASGEHFFTFGGGGPSAGCMAPLACNFNPDATCDDGSCCFSNCGNLSITTLGTGNLLSNPVWTLMDETETLYSYSVPSIGFPSMFGTTTNHPICLEHGCYTISMETGGWLTPVDWSLHFPTHSIGGSTGFEELFHFGVVAGCTDEVACNYMPEANCDDNSCDYGACTDPLACNFDSDATCENESICLYPGCTYSGALNYNADANVDDGSCTFGPVEFCPEDINGDGVVSIADILAVLSAFGTDCNSESETGE